MARQIHKLTARTVATLKDRGRHGDGGGLYLSISANGGRRWVFLYRRGGRLREMGLGSARDVSLADARAAAAGARKALAAGLDPLQQRQPGEAPLTFAACAEKFIAANKAGWKSAKHAAQWAKTLKTYAYPTIGELAVSDVEVRHVMTILEPLWSTKTETASRVRGRLEAVIDWARASGYRASENPARWRGHLDKLLPKRSRIQRVKHHPALPYAEIGAFMRDLRRRQGMATLALEFLILTAARTGEVLGASPDEIDRTTKTWAIPGSRMKAGVEHRVPLSRQALDVLDRAAKLRAAMAPAMGGDERLFSNEFDGRELSSNAMLALLGRMRRDDITAHGFRSTFRDWAAETTSFPNEVCEAALAHRIEDKSEASYRRGDLFEKRAMLMTDWARYCDRVGTRSGAVVPLRLRG
jgi:integrase